MTARRSRPALVVATLAAVPGLAHAGGFALPDQSVVAAGTGGASTARQGDVGATWYNPAALIDGGGLRAAVGVIAASAALEAKDPMGTWSAVSSGTAPLPQLQLAWSRDRLGAGVSLGVPYGGSVRWPAAWAGRHELIASQLEVFRLAPYLGWRRGDLRVAAGLHLDLGHLALERGLDFVDAEGNVAIDLRGVGVGLDLAAWLALDHGVSLGASYKSRTHIALDGEADFEAPDAFAGALPDQAAASAITMPDRLALGARFERGPLAVLADLELTAWGVHDEVVVSFADPDTPAARQVQAWHATAALRAGVEWRLPRWTARFGGSIDPSPTDAEYMAPNSPGATRLGLAVGATYPVSARLELDGSYGFLRVGDATATGESLSATYRGHAHLLGVALRWRSAR